MQVCAQVSCSVDPAASLQQQAIDYAKRGDFGPDAKRVNQQLAEVSPGNLGAWTRLARCCVELGQLDEATVAIDAALQLEPQNTIARNMQVDIARRRMAAAAPAPGAQARRAQGVGGLVIPWQPCRRRQRRRPGRSSRRWPTCRRSRRSTRSVRASKRC